jgi:hypothetical protein
VLIKFRNIIIVTLIRVELINEERIIGYIKFIIELDINRKDN